jgi:hypothetical protein
MWLTITVLVIVAAVLFGIGWGIGYRIGYTDGDRVWREASGKGYARIDSSGRIVQETPEEHEEMQRALREFRAGKPAKVKRDTKR